GPTMTNSRILPPLSSVRRRIKSKFAIALYPSLVVNSRPLFVTRRVQASSNRWQHFAGRIVLNNPDKRATMGRAMGVFFVPPNGQGHQAIDEPISSQNIGATFLERSHQMADARPPHQALAGGSPVRHHRPGPG